MPFAALAVLVCGALLAIALYVLGAVIAIAIRGKSWMKEADKLEDDNSDQ